MKRDEVKKNLKRVSDAMDLFMDFQEEDTDLYPVIEAVKSQNDEAIKKTIRALDRLKHHMKAMIDYDDFMKNHKSNKDVA